MAKAVRLDKFLADAGAGTRSEVKKFIQKGQVQINGETVRRPEQKIEPDGETVTLFGEVIGAAAEFEYFLLHKPAGCVSATEDARDKTVMEYVPSKRKGLFPVGRLDKDTEGLLLITDDGALAHELLSPKKHVAKTYFAKVSGIAAEDDVKAMERGVDIGEEKLTLPARMEILRTVQDGCAENPENAGEFLTAPYSEILLTICEGKFHQVKRMMEAVGKKVLYLKRISMGPLTLPDTLEKGQCRPLTEDEIMALKSTGKTPEDKPYR
ncbi:MAG: pseudouridine synthase [Eubacteriales bacterium]|nr:pseudouridine synthase [Eubacteriales bacterium]